MRASLASGCWPDLAKRVHLLGLRKDVPMCLAASDLYVLPSMRAQGWSW